MINRRFSQTRILLIAGIFCYLASTSIAQERTHTPEEMEALAKYGDLTAPADAIRPENLPDLTKGERYGEIIKIDIWNLGPTGIVGYLVGGFRGDQIQVTSVLPGSPAEGKLQWGDVILGVNGQDFVAGGHMGILFGNAIIEAEKEENGGILKLHVWRDRNFIKRNGKQDVSGIDVDKLFGKAQDDASLYEWKSEDDRTLEAENQNFDEFPIDAFTTEIELKLRVFPPYSDTSPYDCPKVAAILEDAWKVLEKRFKEGKARGGRQATVMALALVASGKPEHRQLIRDWVRSDQSPWRPPTEEIGAKFEPGYKGYKGYQSWHYGFGGLDCAIYYDATGDDFVLPALRKYAIEAAMGQAGGGSWGHTFAYPSFNGGKFHGMNPGYGALNAAGNRCFFLIALAQKLGIKHPEIDDAVERARRFFGSYVDKGAIPYGYHGAAGTDDSNGKNTGVAFALKLLGDNHGAKYFAQMSTHASFTRRGGHGNDYFWHYSPWAATLCGPKGTIATHRNLRWRFTLCRRFDGSFVIQSPTGGMQELRDPTATYVLHYSAPLKQTLWTGKDADESIFWTDKEFGQLMTNALPQLNDPKLIEEVGTPWRERSTKELLERLDIFKPKARGQVAAVLAERYQAGEKDILPQLALLLESDLPRFREGACRSLAACGSDATLQYLSKVARLLQDPEEFVRMQAVRTISAASDSHDTQLALLKTTVNEDTYQNLSMPPNNVRALIQSPLFRNQSTLADSPFDAGFDDELVQAALERLIELDPMGNRAFLTSRQNVWSKDTVIRLAGPLTFVAEDKQINDQMFGGGRHEAGRILLGRFGYREFIETSAGPLLKNAALPRDIRPKVSFKIPLVDPEAIKKNPAACHDLLEPLKLWLADEPMAKIGIKDGKETIYTNAEDLISLIEAQKNSIQLPSIATDVEQLFQDKLAEVSDPDARNALCRRELEDPTRKTFFRQMAAMNYLVETLGPDAIDDLVPLLGHDYWRLRDHARKLAIELAESGSTSRLIERFPDTDGPTAAGILTVLADSNSKAALQTARLALQHKDAIVRQAAVQAVMELGDDDAVLEVFGFMQNAKLPEELRGCEQAVLSRRDEPEYTERVRGMAITALPQCDPPARHSLYWILAQLGGENAIDVLHQATATANDNEFREIVNSLSYSPDERASNALLSIIKENEGTPRAQFAADTSTRRLVIGADDIGNLPYERRLDFAEPLLEIVRSRSVVTYLGSVHSGRCAQILQRAMRRGDGVTRTAAESIISATSGMKDAPGAERKLAAAALIDAIEYIEVNHLRGGGMANDPKSYANWKDLSAQAGKNLIELDRPEEAPLPEFGDLDLDL